VLPFPRFLLLDRATTTPSFLLSSNIFVVTPCRCLFVTTLKKTWSGTASGPVPLVFPMVVLFLDVFLSLVCRYTFCVKLRPLVSEPCGWFAFTLVRPFLPLHPRFQTTKVKSGLSRRPAPRSRPRPRFSPSRGSNIVCYFPSPPIPVVLRALPFPIKEVRRCRRVPPFSLEGQGSTFFPQIPSTCVLFPPPFSQPLATSLSCVSKNPPSTCPSSISRNTVPPP